MEKLFIHIFHMSGSASYLILAVLLARFLLQKAPKRMRSFLWLLVGIRLIVPFSVESIFSLIPDTQKADGYLYQAIQPDTNIVVPEREPASQPMQNENVFLTEKNRSKPLTTVEICTWIWLAGIELMFGYLVFSWLRLRNRVKMSVPLEVALEDNSKGKNIVKIYQNDTLESPFLFGIIRPRIYIPNNISSEELPYVVQHELTHKKRKDYLIKPVGFLLLSVYWFNPCVWAAYIMLCKDIELICDECVIRKLGVKYKKAYSQALLNSAVNRRVIAACPVAFGEISVKERVKNILNYKKPTFWVLVAAVLVCIAIPICFMTQKKTEEADLAAATITTQGDYSLFLPQREQQEYKGLNSSNNINQNKEIAQSAKETIAQWAQAFCDRDAKTIIKLASTDVQEYLLGKELLSYSGDEENASFGWSSPWPWGDARNYHIVSVTENSAEILYYAWVSDPHVTVWREILTYKMNEKECIITSETLQFMEGICVAEEYHHAYPNGITGTMMDYYSFNGAGEALNKNAKNNRTNDWYKKLFEPDSAAIFLLNLLNNPNKVGTHVTESGTDTARCTVTFDFYEDGSSISVQMLQPYGTDGIWVPYTENAKASDVASIAPYKITSQNIREIMKENARQLETIFPNHHEFAFDLDFPQNIDLNGDGIEEQIELIDLKYNGGDGGYALRVIDPETGEQIPLPDGYIEENGFPIFATYIGSDDKEPRLLIQIGEDKQSQTIATIMMDAFYLIYDQNLAELKEVVQNRTSEDKIYADAISGCSVITFQDEETPVLLLKTYISGFLGHADTLGYVITELRLQKDYSWSCKHYFLLDSCGKIVLANQEIGMATEGNGIITLPFDRNSNMEYIPIKPEE